MNFPFSAIRPIYSIINLIYSSIHKNREAAEKLDWTRVVTYFQISPSYYQTKEENIEREVNYENLENPNEICEQFSISGEESLCIVCMEKVSNTIINNCGHGGMCDTCIKLTLIRSKKCCHCRKPIDKILVIKPYKKGYKVHIKYVIYVS